MMSPDPTAQHAWLARLVGEWTMNAECEMGPGQPASTSTGRETIRTLGSLWIISDGRMEMPTGGGTGFSQMTLGYDPAKEAFVGSWIGSMMCHMWVYEGKLDEAAKVLTLFTTGPSFACDGTTSHYQDIIEIVSDAKRTLTSRVRMPDDSWKPFMKATYTRLK